MLLCLSESAVVFFHQINTHMHNHAHNSETASDNTKQPKRKQGDITCIMSNAVRTCTHRHRETHRRQERERVPQVKPGTPGQAFCLCLLPNHKHRSKYDCLAFVTGGPLNRKSNGAVMPLRVWSTADVVRS